MGHRGDEEGVDTEVGMRFLPVAEKEGRYFLDGF